MDSVIRHAVTPSFVIPQILNISGSILFTWSLGIIKLSLAAPVANGVSIAANATWDRILGSGLELPHTISGVSLIVVGVALCTL